MRHVIYISTSFSKPTLIKPTARPTYTIGVRGVNVFKILPPTYGFDEKSTFNNFNNCFREGAIVLSRYNYVDVTVSGRLRPQLWVRAFSRCETIRFAHVYGVIMTPPARYSAYYAFC